MRGQGGLGETAAIASIVLMLASAFVTATSYTFECAGDLMEAGREPGERVSASAEVVDKNARVYNSMNEAVEKAEQLQNETYHQFVYSGMDEFPNELAGLPPQKLLLELEPEFLDLSPYREEWNVAIADLRCMLEENCRSVCWNEDCEGFDFVEERVARLPETRPDFEVNNYLHQTRHKLSLFLTAYQDAQVQIEGKKDEVKEFNRALGEDLEKIEPHLTSDYNRTRESLLSLDEDYCSKSYAIPDVSEEFYRNERIRSQFDNTVSEVESGVRFTRGYEGFLLNKVHRLTNASFTLCSAFDRVNTRVKPSIQNHIKLSDCIMEEVEGEVSSALQEAGGERAFYEKQKVACNSRLRISTSLGAEHTLDSQVSASQCLHDYVIKPLKGEVVNMGGLEEDLELTHEFLKIAGDPVDRKKVIMGREFWGEDLDNYLGNDNLKGLQDEWIDLRQDFEKLEGLSVREYSKQAHRIEDELRNIRFSVKMLVNDAHQKRVNNLWSEVSEGVSEVSDRIAWLNERGVNTSLSVNSEVDYLSENSRFRIGEVSAFHAFGHMNRLRMKLSDLLQGLNEKRDLLNPLIASELDFMISLEPVRAELNQPVEVTAHVSADNPFPSEEFSTRAVIKPFSESVSVVVGRKGYDEEFERRMTPVTGSVSSELRGFNHPSNVLLISKRVLYDASSVVDLEIPLGVEPYDLDCGSVYCELDDDSVIVPSLSGSGELVLSARVAEPLEVELGERVGDEQILSVTNNLPMTIEARVCFFTDDSSPVLVDSRTNQVMDYSYDSSSEMVSFSLSMSPNAVHWIQVTSSDFHSLPESEPVLTASSSSLLLKEDEEEVHSYDEVYDLLTRARENYHLIKFASEEHSKLVLVNLRFLNSLISSARSSLYQESDNAYPAAILAFNETENATRMVADRIYDEVMSDYEHIRLTEVNYDGLEPGLSVPDSMLLQANLSQNTSGLGEDVRLLEEYYEDGDVESVILFGSDLLNYMSGLELPQTTHYEQVNDLVEETISSVDEESGELDKARREREEGDLGDSYAWSLRALMRTPFMIPWWLTPGALVSVISLALFVFKDRVAEVGEDLKERVKECERELEEDEMAKYNF